jgi:hypothetical protein
MTDIIARLQEACSGHPAAKIPWPHRLLHDAIGEIIRLRAEVARLKANESNILSVVNCDFNSRRNLG